MEHTRKKKLEMFLEHPDAEKDSSGHMSENSGKHTRYSETAIEEYMEMEIYIQYVVGKVANIWNTGDGIVVKVKRWKYTRKNINVEINEVQW